MTLLISNILHISFKTFITLMSIAACIIKYIEQDLPVEILSWLAYLFIPFVGWIDLSLHSFTPGILLIPIHFWTLLWHPGGQSTLEILQDPKGSKQLIHYDKRETRHCWQERARPVPRWAQHKHCHHLRLH